MGIALLYIATAGRSNATLLVGDAESGWVLSGFFYGYICTQILAGTFSHKLGPKPVFMFGVSLWTLFDLSTILSASALISYNSDAASDDRDIMRSVPFWAVMASRFFMGLGEGVNYPCIHNFAAAWFPKEERSKLISIVSSGIDSGTIFALFFSPIIAKRYGWEYIFLMFDSVNLLWLVLFGIFVSNSPAEDSSIFMDEQLYIERSTSPSRRRENDIDNQVSIPWGKLILDLRTVAICGTLSCSAFGWYIFLGWFPKFLSSKLNFELQRHKFAAPFPYFCGFCGLLFSGALADFLLARKIISVLCVRKIFNTVGMFGSAIGLVILPMVDSPILAIFIVCTIMFLIRFIINGYSVNIIDVAPQYAGQLMSFCNTIATLPGIFGNIITGHILELTGDWTYVFWLSAAFNVVGGILFLMFAKTDPIIPLTSNYPDEAGDLSVQPLLHSTVNQE